MSFFYLCFSFFTFTSGSHECTQNTQTHMHIQTDTYIIIHKRSYSMKTFCHGILNLHEIFCFPCFAKQLLFFNLPSTFLPNSFPRHSLYNQCLCSLLQPFLCEKHYTNACVHTHTHRGNYFDYSAKIGKPIYVLLCFLPFSLSIHCAHCSRSADKNLAFFFL